MAEVKDIVVGSRWRWRQNSISFTVMEVGQGRVLYVYSPNGVACSRGVDGFLQDAELVELPPPPRCAPGCTPAQPCETEGACPVFDERLVAQTLWFGKQKEHRHDTITRWPWGTAPREPSELRCAREWGCGLVRSRR